MELKCPKDPNHELESYINADRSWCAACGVSYLKGELKETDLLTQRFVGRKGAFEPLNPLGVCSFCTETRSDHIEDPENPRLSPFCRLVHQPSQRNGKRNLNRHEPPPVSSKEIQPAVWDLVQMDMDSRDKEGEKRYGMRLRPNNGRDALIDAYQEALDLVVYLRQAIYERDGS